MARKPIFSPRVTATPQKNIVNYALKPHKIGAVIEGLMKEQQKEVEALAQYMDVTPRTVKRWFTMDILPMKHIRKISEWLGVELLTYYRSNVKPDTKELELLQEKLAAANEEIAELKNDVGIKQNRISRLEAKLEVYAELEERRNGKR
ncbi:MAG: hypothetical protein V4615_04530 [Bacteroidota bacterium]